jgi:hypothetical protein
MEGPNPITESNKEKSRLEKYRQDNEKKLSELRLEINSYINRPLDQWSDDEKSKFRSLCGRMLNNFHVMLKNIMKDIEDDGVPMKKVYRWSEEIVAKQILCGDSSEKWSNNSEVHFYNDIRKAFLDNNVDLGVLEQMVDKNVEYLHKINMVWGDKTGKYFNKEEEVYTEEGRLFIKESDEHYCKFYVTIIPAVFNLLDDGYVINDLSR